MRQRAADATVESEPKWKGIKISVVVGSLLAISAATGRAQTEITHLNAPLGIDLSDVQRRFPHCKLDRNPQSRESPRDKVFFPPLTGYSPSFPELTPADVDGTILTLIVNDSGRPSETMAVLDWGAVTVADLWCGPDGASSPLYEFLVFNKKVLAVAKSDVDKNYTEAGVLLETLVGALPGRRGPLHKAFSGGMPAFNGGPRQSVPTYLSYVDNGDLRTVIETKDPYESNMS